MKEHLLREVASMLRHPLNCYNPITTVAVLPASPELPYQSAGGGYETFCRGAWLQAFADLGCRRGGPNLEIVVTRERKCGQWYFSGLKTVI